MKSSDWFSPFVTKRGTVYKDPIDVSKLRSIKAVIFDGDGVLTDNQVLEGMIEVKPRYRSHYDGQGISLLRAIGIHVCFITNEKDESARAIKELVERWNNLPSTKKKSQDFGWEKVGLYMGSGGVSKVESAEKWFEERDLKWEDCAVMGDDLVDIPMLRKAFVAVAPSSAEYVVLQIVDVITHRPGGNGAIRDFVNDVLFMRGIDPTLLPTQ